MNPTEKFFHDRDERVNVNRSDTQLMDAVRRFMKETVRTHYGYNFSWLGRPVIQMPQDLYAMQEIIWRIKPDFIIETGIAHGGSLVFYASMLELTGKGKVIGVDIDIRSHNRKEIEAHPLIHRIIMIEGSSTAPDVIDRIKSFTAEGKSILVVLDSSHTHAHVLKELELYAPFVSLESYCVVFDTGIEDFSNDTSGDRPWGPGNNPKTAVWEFLKSNDHFMIDRDMETKLLITAAPDGYLKRIKTA
jgi:cephalosporin hydroxylase